jgi:hypothetical protein
MVARKTCRCSDFNVVIVRLAFAHMPDARSCRRADATRSHWNILAMIGRGGSLGKFAGKLSAAVTLEMTPT